MKALFGNCGLVEQLNRVAHHLFVTEACQQFAEQLVLRVVDLDRCQVFLGIAVARAAFFLGGYIAESVWIRS